MKVVIDAGHGGKDPGVVNTDNGFTEKQANLETALTLKYLLTQTGQEVELTRVDDSYPSFQDRTYKKQRRCICIHTLQ